jgi:hypothetical protein
MDFLPLSARTTKIAMMYDSKNNVSYFPFWQKNKKIKVVT